VVGSGASQSLPARLTEQAERARGKSNTFGNDWWFVSCHPPFFYDQCAKISCMECLVKSITNPGIF